MARGDGRSAIEPPKLTPEARSRLAGAILGAPSLEHVTVRAGDLRACLAMAEAVQEARELIGENEQLHRKLAAKTVLAEVIPMLSDQLAGARAEIAALKNRTALAVRMLRGQA